MKRRLRLFVGVGALVTAVDVLVLVALAAFDVPLAAANAIAVGVATIVSFVVHRLVTFADDAFALIDHRPLRYALAVGPAIAVDIVVFAVLAQVVDGSTILAVLAMKAVSVTLGAVVRLLTYRRVLFVAVRSDQGRPVDRGPVVGGPRLTVVLPAYCAADVVADTLPRLRAALGPLGPPSDCEVIVVDDGSPDGTATAATAAGADRVVRLTENRGKGAAVRAGMLAARGRTVAFTDVDLAYPPEQLVDLCRTVEEGWDVVVGSRRHPDSVVVRSSPLRELGSVVFNLFSHLLLLGHYRDTQCGLKAFRRDVARSLFGRARIDGFAFDVEILHLAERDRLRLCEVPVTLAPTGDTTVSLGRAARVMMRDVLRVRRRSAQGLYDTGTADGSGAADGAGADDRGSRHDDDHDQDGAAVAVNGGHGRGHDDT